MMGKLIMLIVGCLLAYQISAQTEIRVSLYINFQKNTVVYDRIMQRASGAGPGFELSVNTNSKFRPFLACNWDIFLNPDLLTTVNGNELVRKGSVPCIFTGASYHPLNRVYFEFSTGTCFIESDVFLGIKPCIGFYFDKKQRFTAKLSLTNIFERDKAGNEPFGYVNLGVGIKLF